MMVNAWRTGHKLAWDVPHGCRSYLVQEVLAPHVKSLQANLFLCEICFFRALLDSPSHKVTVVTLLAARDLRSNLGSNLALVRESTGLDPWQAGSKQVKAALQVAHRAAVPPQDR